MIDYFFLFKGAILGTVFLIFALIVVVAVVSALMELFIRFLKWALGIRSPSREFADWGKPNAD